METFDHEAALGSSSEQFNVHFHSSTESEEELLGGGIRASSHVVDRDQAAVCSVV